MVREYISGMMVGCMMESGKSTKWMERGYLLGMMGGGTRGLISMIKNMGTASLNGLMERNMWVNGKMESNMERELIFYRAGKNATENGQMESASDG